MARQGDTQDYLTLVSITKSVSVFPKLLHPPKLVTLSNLDRQCPVHMYLVFFYPKNNNNDNINLALDDDHNSVFGSLKSGLEETLSVWYPAAGRLSWLNPSDADGDNKLNLWCNNEGCVVVEAETEVEISELGDLSQYNDFFEKLVYKPVFHGHFSQMPLVVAQVTKFGCGGYSIGIGISHSLFDGPAAYDFMCAWASNSAAMTMKQHNNNVLEIINPNNNNNNKLPVHDRGTLILLQNGDVEDCRAAAVDHLYQLIMQAAAVSSSDPINLLNNECLINNQIDKNNNYVHKTFHLSGALIESLKREVFCDDPCSSFEVVAAHLWKAKTKALGLRKETMVCLQFAVDARSKVEPPLPEGFSGNAYVLASVALTAAQVEGATHKDIVVKIRESKKSVTNNYVKAYMEAVGEPQTSLPALKELTLISDWTRIPFHKIGFLQQAAAAYASPLASPIPEVTYFMQNPKDRKGIDMRVGLLPQFLDAFARCFLTNE